MAIIISIASGKGGVGKSVVASNLSLSMARRGKRVVLVDLDVGGADIHVLFGMLHPTCTLTDFLYRKAKTLEGIMLPFDACSNLKIIAGTGDTLATANMQYSRKKRLINHLKKISADIVVADLGAGTSFHALDFFLMADHHIVVAIPNPTSMVDLFRFMRLAAVRKVLSGFVSKGVMADDVSKQSFNSTEDFLREAKKTGEIGRDIAGQALREFNPHLILNRATDQRGVNTEVFKKLLKRCSGGNIASLSKIPEDEAVERSIHAFLPVVEHAPESKAAYAFSRLADELLIKLGDNEDLDSVI